MNKLLLNNENKTAVISLAGSIPSFDYSTWNYINNAESVGEALGQVPKGYTATIVINSNGGDLQEAFGIVNEIHAYQKGGLQVNTYLENASSAAFVIGLSGNKRTASRLANATLHQTMLSYLLYPNTAQLIEAADITSKFDDITAKEYERKSNMSFEEIKTKYFDGRNHLLSAEDMLKEGFIDEIQDFTIDTEMITTHQNQAPMPDLQQLAGFEQRIRSLELLQSETKEKMNALQAQNSDKDKTIAALQEEKATLLAKIIDLEKEKNSLSTEKTELAQQNADFQKQVVAKKQVVPENPSQSNGNRQTEDFSDADKKLFAMAGIKNL